jgi:N-acetylmuramoyl-L-alanine amidase
MGKSYIVQQAELYQSYTMIVKLKVLNDFIPFPPVNVQTCCWTFALMMLVTFIPLSSSKAQEYKTFRAKNGDGIYSILKEHGISLKYTDEFIQLNQSKLGRNNDLLIGVTYRLPLANSNNTEIIVSNNNDASNIQLTKQTVKHEIFGEKYAQVEIISDELKGAVYYLVSGHGGPDPGAVAKYNGKTLCEDEYAYDITLRLARFLIARGATVYMITRDNNDGIRDGWYLAPDKDEKCYPNLTIPINQVARLQQRKDAINQLYVQNKGKYQRLVEIHVDSRSKGETIDVFFYYDQRSTAGKKLARNLRDTFDTKYNTHQPGRGYHGTISERSLFMLKYSYPVATFIELGNINHQRDLKRFIIDDNRKALAKWLSEGLLLDYQNNR